VITMLSDDAAVEVVVFGDHGVLDCLAPEKTVHVSMSTISPALVRRLAEAHRERNENFLSAPVLGRPATAEQGKLFVLAAGDQDLIDQLRPVFDAMAQRVFVVAAAPEAANLLEVSCNALLATIIEGIGETLALVTKSRLVDPKLYLDVLLSTVLATPLYQPYADHILEHDFEPGFRMPLALKDMELVLGEGKENTVPMPLVSLIRDHMIEAIAAGYGDLDWAALALVSQDEAGLSKPSGAV
jgi:3-hydroxyisobutyrate dehydrogenase-like beta-hydroxyacid dehydrogenase